MLPRQADLVSECTGLPGLKCKALLKRSDGLDTALYKNIPFLNVLNNLQTVSILKALLNSSLVSCVFTF